VRRRPRVLAAEGDGLDTGLLELGDGVVHLLEGGRRCVDAGVLEEGLGVEHAAREDGGGHGVDGAVDRVGAEGALADGGPRGVVDHARDVHDLAGRHHVRELAATALHEDVRGVARVECGLELAVQVLVLDRLDLDGHAGVGGLEVGDRVLPVLPALAGGRVVPEGHRDGLAATRGATRGGARGTAVGAVSAAATGEECEARAERDERRAPCLPHHRGTP